MGGLVLPGSGGGYVNPIATPVVDYDFKQNLLYGPQLSVSRASSAYIDDLAGNWTLVPANTLRRSDKGALIEGQATNLIRNNSMQAAVVGTPGSLPTNWTASGTTQIVGVGTESGIDYIDLRLTGPTGGGFRISPDAFTQAAAANLYTASAFVKLVAGTLAPFGGSLSHRIAETAPTTNITGPATLTPTNGPLGLQRTSVSKTTQATTTVLRQDIFTSTGATGDYDITLRIGWPQLEQWNPAVAPQGGASSPIRTTGAAATRAADVVTGTLAQALSSGTVVAVYNSTELAANTSNATLFNLGAVAERYVIRRSGGTSSALLTVSAGTATGTATASAGFTPNVRAALAAGFASGDAAMSVSGAAVVTGVPTANPPAQSAFQIGGGVQALNGYIERLAILPARMVNAELQRLSTLSTWGG